MCKVDSLDCIGYHEQAACIDESCSIFYLARLPFQPRKIKMLEFIYFLFPDLLNIKLSFHLKSASNNLFFLALEIYINYWIEKSNVEMGSEPSRPSAPDP